MCSRAINSRDALIWSWYSMRIGGILGMLNSCAESEGQTSQTRTGNNQPTIFISLQNYTNYSARTGPIPWVVNNNIISRI
jgi:predicted phage tail protein